MSSTDPRVSNCRRCQHYLVQGRRGGHCNKLNVGVQGNWRACSLAMPVFASVIDLTPLDLGFNNLMTEAHLSTEKLITEGIRQEVEQSLQEIEIETHRSTFDRSAYKVETTSKDS